MQKFKKNFLIGNLNIPITDIYPECNIKKKITTSMQIVCIHPEKMLFLLNCLRTELKIDNNACEYFSN